ncbi:hypothetical protein K431DRAFT_301568 [Polychaeton citri CBS 116435]|uniref:Uncharacterized protein n=1 Tax=Polychaeton citri CBS 116435 TaxID=1314669 RepID=A0A9P4QDG9_9PEZI|nr:hypothetical protein K431DRAFT_301568 [Polychaeton citri CBS 116435]
MRCFHPRTGSTRDPSMVIPGLGAGWRGSLVRLFALLINTKTKTKNKNKNNNKNNNNTTTVTITTKAAAVLPSTIHRPPSTVYRIPLASHPYPTPS